MPPVAEWTTSPASWESAVSIPAVVMGIEDWHEPPTGGQPITPPRTELTDSALPSVSRQSLRQGTPPAPGRARGLPGTAGQPKAPEATAAWSSLLDEQEASVKKAAEALSPAPAETAPLPSRRSVVQGPAGPEPQRRDRRSTGGKRPAGSGTGENPSSGVLKIVILVAIGLAIGALIYMIATGALASIFADGVGGTAPGGVALAGFLAGWPRLTKEFRDR